MISTQTPRYFITSSFLNINGKKDVIKVTHGGFYSLNKKIAVCKPNLFIQYFAKTTFLEKKVADIKGNILGVHLIRLNLRKTKIS